MAGAKFWRLWKLWKQITPEARAWVWYDWANSAFSLVVMTLFFHVFYYQVMPETVNLLGNTLMIHRSALYSFTISGAFALSGIMAPFLGRWADIHGKRWHALAFTFSLGALATILLGILPPEHTPSLVYPGLLAGGLLCFSLSLGLYNAYLYRIVRNSRELAHVSALGFSMGYLGSVLLAIACVVIYYLEGGSLGSLQISFILTGLWWWIFSWFPLRRLQHIGFFRKDLSELSLRTWRRTLWHFRKTLIPLFLVIFLLSMGIQTVMYLAGLYAQQELNLPASVVVATILGIQLIAIPGAHILAFLAERIPVRKMLGGLALIWAILVILAPAIRTPLEFVGIAVGIGILMGGSQSYLRTVFAWGTQAVVQTLPPAGVFGMYETLEKTAVVAGTFLFGVATQMTGSMTAGAFLVVSFFVMGGLVCLLGFGKEMKGG